MQKMFFNCQRLLRLCIYLLICDIYLINSTNMGSKLVSVDFEIFGHVQGVFFRKYTQKQAKSLDLKGYCMNTYNDTVKGTMQGELGKINEMKEWLRKTGSPSSRIDRAEFTNEEEIKSTTYSDFQIKH